MSGLPGPLFLWGHHGVDIASILGLTVASSKEGRCVGVVGDTYRFLVTGDETDGAYAIWEATIPPGGGPPLHVHSREQEGFFVLQGTMTFQAEDKTMQAGPGTYLNLSPGVKHAFRNNSNETARMLILVAPAGLEKMFFETGVPLKDANETAPPPSPEEIQRLLAAAPRYGVTIFPPQHDHSAAGSPTR